MISWVLLGVAIVAEVTATVSLKLSDGFTRLVPATLVVLGYGASFVLMAKILQRGMHIGVVYAVWSAVGLSIVVVIDAVFFGNRLSPVQLGGIGLIVLGIAALQIGSTAA